MRLPISILFGCIVLFWMVFVFVECNGMGYKTKQAYRYYDQTIDEVENSHFKPEVIENKIEQGRKQGYHITIVEESVYSDIKRYQVTLTYQIGIPILHWKKERKISGYAL